MRKINRAFIHHSASDRDKTSVGMIKKWHMIERGWNHLGYHHIITGNGKIHNTLNHNKQGYHAYDEINQISGNVDSIGICLTGNFQVETPSTDQINSLIKLLKKLVSKYDIPIDLGVIGHRDFKKTLCPGINLYTQLYNIRNKLHKWKKDNKVLYNAKQPLEGVVVGVSLLERIYRWIMQIIKN